jgi:hypothetical protein
MEKHHSSHTPSTQKAEDGYLRPPEYDRTCVQQYSIHSLVDKISMQREGGITEYQIEIKSQSPSEKAALNRGLNKGHPEEVIGGMGEVGRVLKVNKNNSNNVRCTGSSLEQYKLNQEKHWRVLVSNSRHQHETTQSKHETKKQSEGEDVEKAVGDGETSLFTYIIASGSGGERGSFRKDLRKEFPQELIGGHGETGITARYQINEEKCHYKPQRTRKSRR